MKRIAAIALLALAGCNQQPAEPKADLAKGGPPPIPPSPQTTSG